MKRLIFILGLIALSSSSCGPDKPKHTVNYILLTDQLTPELINNLRRTFFTYRDDSGNGLTQFLPENVSSITYSIYHPYTANSKDPEVITFNSSNTKMQRSDDADKYLKELKAIADSTPPFSNQDILHQLEQIIDNVKGTDGNTTILL